MPERAAPSKGLTDAAVRERSRLSRELAKLDLRLATLRVELSRAEAERIEVAAQISRIDDLIGAPQPTPEALEPRAGYLRGAEIRHAAIRVAANRARATTPLHYSDWYAHLREAGYAIDGRDPLATFLTQLNRSPLIVKAAQPGYYALDLNAIDRLQARLTELHTELSGLHAGQQTISEIASVRDRRNELLAEISRTERALDEALTHSTN